MPTPQQEFSTLPEVTQYADLNSDDIFLGQDSSKVPFIIENQNFLPCNQLLSASLTVTHGQILLLNGTPQQIVVAAGAGKAIWAVSAYVLCDYTGAVVYATNTKLIIENHSYREQLSSNSLDYSATRYALFEPRGTASAAQNQLVANTDLELSVDSGNPTGGAAGNFITVTVYYYIVNI